MIKQKSCVALRKDIISIFEQLEFGAASKWPRNKMEYRLKHTLAQVGDLAYLIKDEELKKLFLRIVACEGRVDICLNPKDYEEKRKVEIEEEKKVKVKPIVVSKYNKLPEIKKLKKQASANKLRKDSITGRPPKKKKKRFKKYIPVHLIDNVKRYDLRKRVSKSKFFICGMLWKKNGIENDVTNEMLKEFERLYGEERNKDTLISFMRTRAVIRGYLYEG
jgi:hypothetical protein